MSHVRRTSRLILVTAAAVTLLATLGSPVAAAGGKTRWVDDDGKAGPNGCGGTAPAFKKIQNAVNRSGPGDTVLVCPGTYRGTVHIKGRRDGLTLRATRTWEASLVPPTQAATSELDMISIDEVDDVTVSGLRVSAANEPNCSRVDVGILILGSRGAQVTANHIFASPQSVDCGYTNGILMSSKSPAVSGPTIPASGLIAHNLVTNFQFWGIAAGDDANVRATITDNSMHYYLTQAATASVSAPPAARRGWRGWAGTARAAGPAGSAFRPAGVFVLGGAAAMVNLNVVQSAEGAVVAPVGPTPQPATLNRGIDLDTSSGGVVVKGNLVRRVTTGIRVQADAARIEDNLISITNTGIDVGYYGYDKNSVRGNRVEAFTSGIYVYSTDNVFRQNRVSTPSTGHDCEDYRRGSGTLGTASTWVDNTGTSTSYPDGICPHA